MSESAFHTDAISEINLQYIRLCLLPIGYLSHCPHTAVSRSEFLSSTTLEHFGSFEAWRLN